MVSETKTTATVKIIADKVVGGNYGVFANMARENTADIYPQQINIILAEDSSFKENTSSHIGGAVTLWNDSSWNNNEGLKHQIVGSTFESNSATNKGGAVGLLGKQTSALGGSTTISDSTFKGNSVKGASGLGGAVYGENTALIVDGNTDFSGNSASSGGAIALAQNTKLTITDQVTFKDNKATKRGGAIYTDGTTEIAIDGASFISNTSGDTGGAIAISNFKGDVNPVTIKNTLFEGNTAVRKGGAIVIFDMEEDYNNVNNVVLEAVTFRNNAVTNGDGGAIMVEEAVTIQGSALFEGNSASANGGAIYGASGSSVTLNAEEAGDAIVFKNNTANGAANDIYLAEGSEAEFKGDGSIELLSGLAGAGSVESSAANVYVADVKNFTGSVNITNGVFAVEAGDFLNAEDSIFGTDATVTIAAEGELKLAGVTKVGTIKVTDDSESLTNNGKISFEDAFLTGTLVNGSLTIKTNDAFITNSDFGDDSTEIQANLASLFARGATPRESDILEQISNKFVAEGDTADTAVLSAEGVEAFRQATGGSATAGAFNVAYDAQTQFTDSIIRHQLGEHNGYGVWADVYYTSNEAKTLYGNSGYKTDIYGGVVGFDATFSCGATAGIAVTVGTGDTDTVGALKSSLDTDFYGVSLYTSKDFSGFDAKLDVGYMSFDNDFAGLGDASDVDAWTAGLRGDFKAYEGSVMSITPHVGLRYTHFKSDAVAFNGETSLDVFEAPIGVAFNGNFETNGWKIVPALDFSIVPQLGDTDVDTFAGTVDVIDNLYNTTLGVAATYQNLTFGLDYRYGFGNEDRSNNSVNLKVRYRF